MHAGSIIEQTDGAGAPPTGGSDMRGRLRGMWAAVAPAWGEHAEFVDDRVAAATQRMLDATRPRSGERVLDLACGVGGAGLAAAPLVAPGGEVVMSDLVAEMTAIAASRAAALGLDNVSTCELDLERIEQPDGSYDVVLCREGMMFAPDPAAAAGEIRRVLRPGGRAAISVWGPREENPWLSLILDALSAQLGRPVPPPGVPGPFSLDDRDRLGGLLRDAGLADVAVEPIDAAMRVGSFEEWWQRTSALAGPLAQFLGSLPEPAMQALVADLRERSEPYRSSGGLAFPGVALLATGRVEG